MLDLSSLNQFKEREYKPSLLDFIYFLFFENGITLKEFNELPIPYIIKMFTTKLYVEKNKVPKTKDTKGSKTI